MLHDEYHPNAVLWLKSLDEKPQLVLPTFQDLPADAVALTQVAMLRILVLNLQAEYDIYALSDEKLPVWYLIRPYVQDQNFDDQ